MPRNSEKFAEIKAMGYASWRGMITRCYNENSRDYKDYGGRGISVAPEWRKFSGFLSSMGARPKGMTIERIDVNGDYEPGNCKWLPSKDQAKNMRKTIWLEVDGKMMCMKDACKEIGASYSMVRLRIWRLGWDPQKALYTPSTGSGRKKA